MMREEYCGLNCVGGGSSDVGYGEGWLDEGVMGIKTDETWA